MGGAKREFEEWEEKQAIGLSLLLQAGCIRQCRIHDTYQDAGVGLEAAYRKGNSKISNGEFAGVFSDRKEMTDAVLCAFNENAMDRCYACERLEAE